MWFPQIPTLSPLTWPPSTLTCCPPLDSPQHMTFIMVPTVIWKLPRLLLSATANRGAPTSLVYHMLTASALSCKQALLLHPAQTHTLTQRAVPHNGSFRTVGSSSWTTCQKPQHQGCTAAQPRCIQEHLSHLPLLLHLSPATQMHFSAAAAVVAVATGAALVWVWHKQVHRQHRMLSLSPMTSSSSYQSNASRQMIGRGLLIPNCSSSGKPMASLTARLAFWIQLSTLTHGPHSRTAQICTAGAA